MDNNIYLIGFMGCGKSTIAAGLNQMYGSQVVEMDQWIVERENMTIPEIFKEKGEPYFRDVETSLLKEIAQKTNQVVSCGGGIVLREENVLEMKKSGKIILLTAKPETILERVSGDDNRPVLQGKKTVADISALIENRRSKYEAAADFIVETDEKTVLEICQEIRFDVK